MYFSGHVKLTHFMTYITKCKMRRTRIIFMKSKKALYIYIVVHTGILELLVKLAQEKNYDSKTWPKRSLHCRTYTDT